jgi:hypothetical protein
VQGLSMQREADHRGSRLECPTSEGGLSLTCSRLCPCWELSSTSRLEGPYA